MATAKKAADSAKKPSVKAETTAKSATAKSDKTETKVETKAAENASTTKELTAKAAVVTQQVANEVVESGKEFATACKNNIVEKWNGEKREFWYKVVSVLLFATIAVMVVTAVWDLFSKFDFKSFGIYLGVAATAAWMQRVMTYLCDLRSLKEAEKGKKK